MRNKTKQFKDKTEELFLQYLLHVDRCKQKFNTNWTFSQSVNFLLIKQTRNDEQNERFNGHIRRMR